jgi:TrpR-related protein YerC/YecD
MPKKRFAEAQWRSDPGFRALCRALLSCRRESQLADFLRDVGTLSELREWSERWAAARELAQGRSYAVTAERTGASITTVARVARFLYDGTGGYRQALAVAGQTLRHHGSTPRRERVARPPRRLRRRP